MFGASKENNRQNATTPMYASMQYFSIIGYKHKQTAKKQWHNAVSFKLNQYLCDNMREYRPDALPFSDLPSS